ncbi:unnamed protein product [Arabidopsis arenosa]|uniref:Uncharacterized protein n=1 Tax=Arabidopsis arenosa TaxID=38785 RepID=A0A8S1ZY66_ARAAE|nr:unnamed protein product [Arabidopsis arenosa]
MDFKQVLKQFALFLLTPFDFTLSLPKWLIIYGEQFKRLTWGRMKIHLSYRRRLWQGRKPRIDSSCWDDQLPRRQNLRSIVASMPRVWGQSSLVHGRIIPGNQFQFVFPSEESLETVIRRGPWAFNDRMLILQRWTPLMNPPLINFIPFWIQVRGIALQYLTLEVINSIGRALGNLADVDYDAETAARVEFVRIQINWNIDTPVMFQRNFQFQRGVNTLLRFRFERLRGFCEVCGMLTHDSGACLIQNGGEEDHQDGDDDDHAEPNPPVNQNQNQGVVIREIEADEANGDVMEDEPAMAVVNEAEEIEAIADIDPHHNALVDYEDEQEDRMALSIFRGEWDANELFNPVPIFENSTGDIPGSEANRVYSANIHPRTEIMEETLRVREEVAVERGKRKKEDTIEQSEETVNTKVKFQELEEGSSSSHKSNQCRGAQGDDKIKEVASDLNYPHYVTVPPRGPGYKSSFIWKSLLEGRDLLRKGMRFLIGNGNTTQAWLDPWLPKLGVAYGPVTGADCGGGHSDMLGWHYTDSGIYTVKSGYWLASHSQEYQEDIQPPPGSQVIKDAIWKMRTAPKLQHFLWRMISNALAMKTELARRGVAIDTICKRCQRSDKTTAHLFFECPHVQEIWKGNQQLHHIICNPTNSFMLKIKAVIECYNNDNLSSLEHQIPIWTLWRIWKSRNQLLYQNLESTWQHDTIKSIEEATEWVSCWQDDLSRNATPDSLQRNSRRSHWKKPRQDFIKCNYDCKFSQNGNETRSAWIVRDSDGFFIRAGLSRGGRVLSVLEAELQSLVMAMQHTWSQGNRRVIFEGDNQTVLKLGKQQSG